MSQHTPGPWAIIKRLSDVQSCLDTYVGLPERRGQDGRDYSLAWAEEHVCQVFHQSEENARLIAAAPEMLAELAWIANHYELNETHLESIRALLARIEGKEST